MIELQLDQLFTYHLITADCEDEKDLSEMLYKIQLLELFRLTDFEEIKLNKQIDELYDQLKHDELMNDLFDVHPYKEIMNKETMFKIGRAHV